MSIIDEAKRFLDLHDTGVKTAEQPIEVLRAVVDRLYVAPLPRKERPSKR